MAEKCESCGRPTWDGGHAISDKECISVDLECRALATIKVLYKAACARPDKESRVMALLCRPVLAQAGLIDIYGALPTWDTN